MVGREREGKAGGKYGLGVRDEGGSDWLNSALNQGSILVL